MIKTWNRAWQWKWIFFLLLPRYNSSPKMWYQIQHRGETFDMWIIFICCYFISHPGGVFIYDGAGKINILCKTIQLGQGKIGYLSFWSCSNASIPVQRGHKMFKDMPIISIEHWTNATTTTSCFSFIFVEQP